MNTSLIKASIANAYYKTRSMLVGNLSNASGLLALINSSGQTTKYVASANYGSFGTFYPQPLDGGTLQQNSVTWSNDGTLICYSGTYASGSDSRVQVYPFVAGFGTLYSGGPAVAGTVSALRAKLNYPSTAVAFAVYGDTTVSAAPIRAYAFSKSTGYGTQYANYTATAQSNGTIAWHPSNTAIVYCGSYTGASSCSFILPWSDSTGFGTQVNTPTPTTVRPVFNATGTAIAFVDSTASPYLIVYPWTGSAFGTAYASITAMDLRTTQSQNVAWSPTNNTFVRGYRTTSPYIGAYPWTDAGGVGTKYTNPASAWVGYEVTAVAVSPTADTISCSSGYNFSGGEGVQSWNFTEGTGFGTKYPASNIWPFSQAPSLSYRN